MIDVLKWNNYSARTQFNTYLTSFLLSVSYVRALCRRHSHSVFAFGAKTPKRVSYLKKVPRVLGSRAAKRARKSKGFSKAEVKI